MTRPYGLGVAVLAKRSPEEQAERAIVAFDGIAWPADHSVRRLLHWVEQRRDLVVAPVGGGIAAALLAAPGERPRVALLAWAALSVGAGLARRVAAQAALLPLMRHVYPLLGPLLGAVVALLIAVVTDAPEVSPLELLAVVAAAAFLAPPMAGRGTPPRRRRRAAPAETPRVRP